MAKKPRPTGLDDRRANERRPGQSEVLISWHHDPGQGVRYALVNEGPSGCLITSSVPLVDGMTGTVLGTIPETGCHSASVLVAWCRHVGGRWHVGLRYFGVV